MKGMSAARGLRKAGGFALTELLLTIGIIALVLGAVAAIAISTSAGQTAQSEARLIDSAASKIRSVYSSRPDFAGLDTDASVKFEAWPTSMVVDNGGGTGFDVFNAWGGSVQVQDPVATAYSGQVASRLFRISTSNVSEAACSELATAQTAALAVEVGGDATTAGTTVYERGESTTPLDPIDVSLVAANCTEGTTVHFIYGKNG